MKEQRSAGAGRAFALETLDERGGLGSDGAQLAAILARFGMQRGEAVPAITQGRFQQRVHGDLAARGVRDVVEACGDFLGAARQLTARERFQHQRSDESVTEQRDLFGFVIHEWKRKGKDGGGPCKWCVGKLRRERARRAV